MSSWEIFVREFITYDGYKTVISGLRATILIAVLGLLIGIAIGTLLASAKVVPRDNVVVKILAKLSDIYVGVFRGTPIVVQLLVVYYILFPALGLRVNEIYVAIAVFGMNSGAYIAEIMRSGILSVDSGQMEAGRSLGLGYTATMSKIVLPQAIKNILPTLGNEFIALIKETSVVSFIAVVDLTKAFKSIADSTYEYIVPYLMLALTYLVLVIIITILIKLMEARLRKSDKR
ncbi:MAG: amino acid ABC transporter permease [Clostridia bacterium]